MSQPVRDDKVVLAAIDLHKGSKLVMSRALDHAADCGAELHLAYITEPNIANVKPPEDMDAPELTGTDMHKCAEFIAHRREDFEKNNPGRKAPEVKVHHDTGDPAEKIVEIATEIDADMVILGTHGRTGIKRLLIGSVAEKVVRLSGCSVLVVREKKHGDTA